MLGASEAPPNVLRSRPLLNRIPYNHRFEGIEQVLHQGRSLAAASPVLGAARTAPDASRPPPRSRAA